MGKSSSSAPSPDPAIGQAALKQAQLGEDYLAFSKSAYADSVVRQDAQDALAAKVTNNQLAASKQSQQWATEDRSRYKTVFQPLQDEFIDQAKNWGSADRQESVAAEAKADVLNNASQQQGAAQRNMAAMGVDPTSGRYAGVERSGAQATALAAAGAENTARNTVRSQGLSLLGDAANMGSGLAVNPAASLGLSSSTGSAALSATSANNAQANGNASIVGNGYSSAMNGYGNQASILNQQYGNTLNAWQANTANSNANAAGTASAAGSIIGIGVMAF